MENSGKKTAARASGSGAGRTRAYYGYSRNGCARCKQQRVRCDEQHPECDRCVRVGVRCPGYEQKLRWSAKHEIFRPDHTGQKKKSPRQKPAQRSPTQPGTSSPNTAASLHTGRASCIQQLSGHLSQPQHPQHLQHPQDQQHPHHPQHLESQPSQQSQQPQRPSRLQEAQQTHRQRQTHQRLGTAPQNCSRPPSLDDEQASFFSSLMAPGTAATATTTATTATTTPQTQISPQTESSDPEMDILQTAAPEAHPADIHFEHFIPLDVEVPDFYMGMNSSLFQPQKVLDSVGLFHGPMAAPADLDPGWASGLSLGEETPVTVISQPMPAEVVVELAGQADDVEYIHRADYFEHGHIQGLDVFPRSGWSPGSQSHGDGSSFPSSLSSTFAVSPGDKSLQEESSCSGGANFGETAYGLSTSKALQPIHAAHNKTAPSLNTVTLNDFSTVFVEFYFKVTAQLYSCYDSRMNPFRSAVIRTWSSSRIIYCTLQSMAAASLVKDFPEVAPIGRQLRQEAADLLANTSTWDTNSMLAILMLGGTSGWHNPRDLGLPFFNQIAACLASAPASAFGGDGDNRNYRFFRESMLYWEMLLAFVADNDAISTVPDERPDEEDKRAGPEALPAPQVPHPWTGFCAETQLAVVKIGRLVRRQRKFSCAHRFATMAQVNQLRKDMATARELEERLMHISHPPEQSVKDTEDRNTPVWHLLTLAEIIRDTGLIQLYHVFPDLLTARLRREHRARNAGPLADASEDSDVSTEVLKVTQEDRSKWLTSYTLRSLELMKMLPIESGTRDFQPFLLVALSSELRINKRTRAGLSGLGGHGGVGGLNGLGSLGSLGGTGMGGNLPLHVLLNLDMETVEVTRARGFIHSRLTAFLHALPPKPILACLDIVKETWVQMDKQVAARVAQGNHWMGREGEADVYWMDVMIDNGWETIMA